MRRCGRTYIYCLRTAMWLSINRDKKAYHASIRGFDLASIYKKFYPHLIVLKVDSIGVGLKFPACDR